MQQGLATYRACRLSKTVSQSRVGSLRSSSKTWLTDKSPVPNSSVAAGCVAFGERTNAVCSMFLHVQCFDKERVIYTVRQLINCRPEFVLSFHSLYVETKSPPFSAWHFYVVCKACCRLEQVFSVFLG